MAYEQTNSVGLMGFCFGTKLTAVDCCVRTTQTKTCCIAYLTLSWGTFVFDRQTDRIKRFVLPKVKQIFNLEEQSLTLEFEKNPTFFSPH